MGDLNEKLGRILKEEDERLLVEASLKNYQAEMLKTSLQVFTLCLALAERHEKSYKTLENSGLSNLFNLFWSRLCQIFTISLKKILSPKAGDDSFAPLK